MSRHVISALPDAGNIEVVVGWDPPLNTFFAQINDLDVDEDDPTAELLSIGTGYGEIHDLRRIRSAVAPWAEIPNEVERALYSESHS